MLIKYLLNGKEIDLTGDTINIKSNNFKVDENGNMTCTSATVKNATINGGQILLEDTSGMGNEFSINSTNYITMIGSSMLTISKKNSEVGVHIDLTESDQPILMVNKGNGINTLIKGDGITTPKLTQTSLAEKKENIEKLEVNAIELIKIADICLYNLKGIEESKKHIGLVIGEGYNCPNEVISEDGQGVDPYSMVSLLWKAVQELTAKVERLEQEVANGRNN